MWVSPVQVTRSKKCLCQDQMCSCIHNKRSSFTIHPLLSQKDLIASHEPPCQTNLPHPLLLPPLAWGSLKYASDVLMNTMKKQRPPKPGWTLSTSTCWSTMPSTMMMTEKSPSPCHTWRKELLSCGQNSTANKVSPLCHSGHLPHSKLILNWLLEIPTLPRKPWTGFQPHPSTLENNSRSISTTSN